MQEKTVQIHFRATEKERLRFQANAKKCGLSLSEYLRKLANGYEPKSLPPIKYPELVEVLANLYGLYRYRQKEEAAEKALYLITRLTEEISPQKRGDANGDNENLAGTG
jgi:hypothetical protein